MKWPAGGRSETGEGWRRGRGEGLISYHGYSEEVRLWLWFGFGCDVTRSDWLNVLDYRVSFSPHPVIYFIRHSLLSVRGALTGQAHFFTFMSFLYFLDKNLV